jgi:hypothetical protein
MRAKLHFLLWYIRRYWFQLLVLPLARAMNALLAKPVHEGIGIMVVLPNSSNGSLFVVRTIKALELIKTRDPRRFRRIKREFRIITDMCPTGCGGYNRPLRECWVDLASFDFANQPDLSLERYCCLLVHEATHGHCYSHYIPYDRNLRERIERLCRREEERFARRAFPETCQELIREFDPADWHFSWYASAWAKFVRRWRKFMKILRTKDVAATPDSEPPKT